MGDEEEMIFEEITQGGLPSNVRAEIISEPAVCGQNFTRESRVYPEKCSRPAGHKPLSQTSNHYCFGIGWWP